MGRMVIAVYVPKPGKDAELMDCYGTLNYLAEVGTIFAGFELVQV